MVAHAAQSGMRLRDIIAKLRHDGCGGGAGRVELLTGIEGASSRPARRIVLLGRAETLLSASAHQAQCSPGGGEGGDE